MEIFNSIIIEKQSPEIFDFIRFSELKKQMKFLFYQENGGVKCLRFGLENFIG